MLKHQTVWKLKLSFIYLLHFNKTAKSFKVLKNHQHFVSNNNYYDIKFIEEKEKLFFNTYDEWNINLSVKFIHHIF